MLKNLKLTTECGYRWRWDQNYYWKNPRFRYLGTGIAFGPVMFFWNWE